MKWQKVLKRLTLLKILAVDMASLDAESRIEPLVEFKKVYGRSLDLVRQILENIFQNEMRLPINSLFLPFSHFFTAFIRTQK